MSNIETLNNFNVLEQAKDIIETEVQSIKDMSGRLDESFVNAIEMMFKCKGRIIVTGMGKSGLIGRKIAATLASTGAPSFFLHPAEGIHGDLGTIMSNDLVLMISNSGKTEEVLKIIPTIKKMGLKLILLTGKVNSPLSDLSDVVLDISVKKEACPIDIVPTSSTTVTLVMGDALCGVLLLKKGFKKENFAFFHPGGALGKRLLLLVDDIMHSGSANAVVSEDRPMKEAILEITAKGLGATSCVNHKGELTGLITDGDLRRAIEKYDRLFEKRAGDIMTKNPVVIKAGKLAAEAVNLMENRPSQLMVLPVVDEQNRPVGIVRVHDLVKAGVT